MRFFSDDYEKKNEWEWKKNHFFVWEKNSLKNNQTWKIKEEEEQDDEEE